MNIENPEIMEVQKIGKICAVRQVARDKASMRDRTQTTVKPFFANGIAFDIQINPESNFIWLWSALPFLPVPKRIAVCFPDLRTSQPRL